jgi:hypothetical protein
LQLRGLRLGLFQDGDVGVGLFPDRQEVLISRLGFGGVARGGIGAGDAEPGERVKRAVLHDNAGIELSEVSGGDCLAS